MDKFNETEKAITQNIKNGKTIQETAQAMKLSERTVTFYLASIFSKIEK